MFLIMKWLAALGLYFVVSRLFGTPIAGIVAGYAYGFGACSNHEFEHLDVPVSMVLLPLIFLASVKLLRRRSTRWAPVLGVLVACQLGNNWVQASISPLVFLLLLAFRPWREDPGDENPLVDRALAARWLRLALVAVLVFLVLGASQLAWIAGDARNHMLFPPELVALDRELYIEGSPFLFVNRDNWMASWLALHHPPGLDVAEMHGGRRYRGLAALAVCLGGWFASRRSNSLRRWYPAAGLLLLVQYWMSLGAGPSRCQAARLAPGAGKRHATRPPIPPIGQRFLASRDRLPLHAGAFFFPLSAPLPRAAATMRRRLHT